MEKIPASPAPQPSQRKEQSMSDASASIPAQNPSALQAIGFAGLLAGVMDITAAFVTAWALRGISPVRVLHSVASGLLGAKAFEGGVPIAILGLALHFLIATTAAAVFYAASRKLAFLTQRAVLSGLAYGVAVYLFMNLVVLPLSAAQPRYTTLGIVVGLIVHMLCVGLPISLVVRRLSAKA
jgi:hypothetical protein